MTIADINLAFIRCPSGNAFEGIAKSQVGIRHAPTVFEQSLVVFSQVQWISPRPEFANGRVIGRR